MTTYLEGGARQFENAAGRLLSAAALRQSRTIAAAGRVALVLVAVLAVYDAGRALTPDHLAVWALTLAWIVAFRLGTLAAPHPLGPCVACAAGGVFGLVLTSAIAQWLPAAELSAGRSLVMAAAVVASVAVWDCAVRHTTAARRRVLVVGAAGAADAVAREALGAGSPLDVVGLVHDADDAAPQEVPDLGPLDDLDEIVAALQPDLVVVADGSDCASAVDRLLDVADHEPRVVGLTSFFEDVFGRVPVTSLSSAWFMSLVHARRRAYARWSKRTFDLVAASVALLLAAPVMAAIALLLAPTGSVLYRQTRLGERGRRFTILKFRTMRADAEQAGEAVWWAGEGDPRVTKLGRILRRAHLDELPQLFNVLRGEMSMVGPRPERPEFVEMLEERVPFWHRRLLVNPGVTGWAQLRGGYAADCEGMADKLSYDLWYLRNRNVVVDLAICVRTATEMLAGLIPRKRGRIAR